MLILSVFPIQPLVLPRPIVRLFANKLYLLFAYVTMYMIAVRDADVGWIVGIVLGYFHMQYLSGIHRKKRDG